MADEEDYLDLVIAGELVAHWLQVVATSSRYDRVAEAVKKLRDGVERSEAYVEEAAEEGASEVLAAFLKRSEAEWGALFDDVQAIVAKLEEHGQRHGTVTSLKYGAWEIRLRQGALQDGLGARLWNVSHIMNEFLAAHGAFLQDCEILELGSGVGSTGILAAQIAPTSHVVLTDCVSEVLEILKTNCRLNPPSSSFEDDLECVIEQMNDHAIEALCCEKGEHVALEGFMAETDPWEFANMKIRRLDWRADAESCDAEAEDASAAPGRLEVEETFDVIFGCEVLYEEESSTALPAVIQQRLRHDGRCLIAGAVREEAVYEAFVRACEERKLRIQERSCEGAAAFGVALAEYEGGVRLMAIDHEASTAWEKFAEMFRNFTNAASRNRG